MLTYEVRQGAAAVSIATTAAAEVSTNGQAVLADDPAISVAVAVLSAEATVTSA